MAEVLGPLMANGGIILHGEQEFTYRRPIFAGDVLVGEGQGGRRLSQGVEGTDHDLRRRGDRVDANGSSGEAVCTSRMNIIHRI